MKYFSLKTKHIDIDTDDGFKIIINQQTADKYFLKNKDNLVINVDNTEVYVEVCTTKTLLENDEIGLCQGIRDMYSIPENKFIKIWFAEEPLGLEAIHKKLLGQRLNYKDCLNIMNDLITGRLNEVEIAFFIGVGFQKHAYTIRELGYLTKAQAYTGDQLRFKGVIADKHSVGGLSGNRTTPIVVPIVSSFGIKIPKTSSRAITSVSGTADTLETIMDISFSVSEIYKLMKKNNACMVWGGALNLSPTDNYFINITKDLGIEPADKLITSVLSKKLATGVNRLVIDIPVNETAKIKTYKDAIRLKVKFKKLSRKLGIQTDVIISKTEGIVGEGVGPALEMRDVLRVLQQKDNRPKDLEEKSIKLAGRLLKLCGYLDYDKQARENLKTGKALLQFRNMVEAQGGNFDIDSEDIELGKYVYEFKLNQKGEIPKYDNEEIVNVCKMLGAPQNKKAGIYFNKKTGERYLPNDIIFTAYSSNENRMGMAKDMIRENFKPLFK